MKELLDTGVKIDLTYYDNENALIGSIKGYSAAVRENLSTGSYGILMWVKRGDDSSADVEEYLTEQQKKLPELIKNFRVTELGTAIALNRANDPYKNITSLKRFLYDLADFLSKNSYVNCCCKCAASDELGIYSADGVITQTCASCGSEYRPILVNALVKAAAAGAVKPPVTAAPAEIKEEPKPAEAKAPEAKPAPEPSDGGMAEYLASIREKNKNFKEELAAEVKAEETKNEIAAAFAEAAEKNGKKGKKEKEKKKLFKKKNKDKDKTASEDISGSSVSEKQAPEASAPEKPVPEKPAGPEKAATAAEKPVEKPEKKAESEDFSDLLSPEKPAEQENTEGDEFSDLLAPEKPAEPENEENDEFSALLSPEKEDSAPKNPALVSEEEALDALMFSEEPEKKPEPPKSELFEQIEREYAAEQAAKAAKADEAGDGGEEDEIDDLLFDELMDAPEEEPEDVFREVKKEPVPEIVFTELLINEGGEIEVKEAEKEVDDGTVVTEIHDDSNDGDPMEVDELKRFVYDPTDTNEGEKLSAEETPLEVDGSVPLVNPNANRDEKQVSSVDGPDAVKELEEQINKYTHQVDEPSFAKGFATAVNMIDRDAPVRYSNQKRKKHDAPPAFNMHEEYAALSRSGSGTYEVTDLSYRSSASHVSSRPIRGLLGALLLGVAGVVIWAALANLLSPIGWICSFAAVLASFGGYYIFGKALDKKGIVISLLMAFLLTFVGAVLITLLDEKDLVTSVFGPDASLVDEIKEMANTVAANYLLKRKMVSNLLFSYIVTVISGTVTSAIFWKRTF